MTAPGLDISEAEWQQQVIDLASALGWRVLHIRRSVGKGKRWTTTTSIVGWPDIFGIHPTKGFAAIELKVGRNRPTEDQLAVLEELRAAGARVMVAWPSDFDALVSLLR